MKSRRLVYLDVGTHIGQEYCALFSHSKSKMAWLFLKLFVASFIYPNRGIQYIGLSEALKIMRNVNAIRRRKHEITTIVIEPNSRLFHHKVYSEANKVFCLALSNSKAQFSFENLYFPSSNKASQGASIYRNKKGVNDADHDTIVAVDSSFFARMLKRDLDSAYGEFGYDVVLRLNCEGAEDSAIYAFRREFGGALTLVMGSLKDVGEIKGSGAMEEMNTYISAEGLEFVPFTPLYHTWSDASSAILKALH